jgi:hypothetical protein
MVVLSSSRYGSVIYDPHRPYRESFMSVVQTALEISANSNFGTFSDGLGNPALKVAYRLGFHPRTV